MRDFWERFGVAVVMLAVGAAIGLLLILTVDPACGPDGDSQRECAAELARDLTGGR